MSPKHLLTKILVLLLSVGILPLILVGTQLISQSRSTLETLAQERQQNLVLSLAKKIDQFIEDIQRNLVVSLYGHSDLYRKDESFQKKYFQFLIDTFPAVTTISLFDRHGTRLTSVTTELLDRPPSEFQRHLDHAPLKEVLEKGVVSMSSTYRRFSSKEAPRFTMGIPLSGAAGTQAMIAVEITLDEIQNLISEELQLGPQTSIFVVNGENKRVLARDTALTGDKLVMKVELLNETTPQSRLYEHQDQIMVGAMAPLKNGWKVLVQEPEEVTFASAIRMRQVVTFTVVLTLVIAAWLGWLFSGALVKPLRVLVKATRKIAAGDYSFRVTPTTQDELSLLAHSFNEMSESILVRNEQLRSLNETAKELASILDRASLVSTVERIFKDFLKVEGVGIVTAVEGRWLDPLNQQTVDVSAWESQTGFQVASSESPLAAPQGWNHLHHLCMSLTYRDEAKGWLWVFGKKEAFTDLQKEYVETVGTSIAISLTNIELLEKAVEGARMEEELKTAELVQHTLFPEQDPSVPGLEITGYIQSASETGGDWYGYLEDKESKRLTVLIGDVTGHGVPAALVTAATNAFFATVKSFQDNQTFDQIEGSFDYLAPDFLLKILNAVILDTAHGRLVMTFFVSTIETETGKMTFANAGHNPPYHIVKSPQKPEKFILPLKARGVRLGDNPDVDFQLKECQLDEGDTVCWYTDGLVECENPEGEEYGKKRLKKVMESVRNEGVITIKEKLLEEAYDFFGEEPRKDDITLVVGRYIGSNIN